MELAEQIQQLYAQAAEADRDEARAAFAALRTELSAGRVRAAEPDPSSPTGWRVNAWVKQGILVGFRCGDVVAFDSPSADSPWLDKDTLPLRPLSTASNVRLVPGGSSVRDGAYLGRGVICMPPMYINIGAYVGSGVHVSAGAQIGGVLEPVGALPVIVEDDALIGGNTGLYEGAVVKRRAVLGAGTVLTGSTPIYDLPQGRIIKPVAGEPTVVPEGAVVVPGARAVTSGAGPDWGLSLATPVIVKYRDDRTDTRTELEAWIR
ncbi:2,3,4,5-tetrahydropyridine-2,6-dicarboxylate N-succinyltransferase [Geodia barretti]|uniref:2,3,4,5-tetrahydropyridine-2,6-dicarboxylate N-succinyltransferase n=1 Tax=Geodia barretti TaxID=519541 RepID=A0AA35RRS9_GEOBA|nr:2,3,4,5-tetrahydropyridine-2,6-dicarboxylate N-succinyltransferase [Geodia barretti]